MHTSFDDGESAALRARTTAPKRNTRPLSSSPRETLAALMAALPLLRSPGYAPAADARGFHLRRLMFRALGAAIGAALLWLGASCYEWGSGKRILPWDPYAGCGDAQPATLPDHVRVGLYEEFPAPWRLAHLKYVDFPVTLAVTAPSRAVFTTLRASIMREYPQVREVYFWPLLAEHEGYYPGTWSDAIAVRRVANEAAGLPVLWDLEMPLNLKHPSIVSWPQNRAWMDQWLRSRAEPVHLWRSHASMGLDPLFLRLVGMHFDPLDYPQVSLHLDLYASATSRTSEEMERILRCGVARYGPRFIPALGVLNDGAGKPEQFMRPETLERDLRLVRAAGAAEVWLFGLNGVTEQVVGTLHQTLPLEHSAEL